MKERGMIFNGEMVRAILEGRKTQTRRIMTIQPEHSEMGLRRVIDSKNGRDDGKYFWSQSDACGLKARSKVFGCPHGSIGDRVWVRETWSQLGNEDGCAIDWNDELVKGGGPEAARIYRASCEQKPGNYGLWSIPDDAFWKPHTDNMEFEGAWRPSIHMPRWASRILLEITDVRVERLNDISDEDAKAEGIAKSHKYPDTYLTPKGDFADADIAFQRLWESIYGEESWAANPWVWVIEFKRV
ncbi:hypothetical protein EB837_12365 [Kluyvera ascorbata]|uniref:Morphogenetic protein n=1 Tax=Kluyvera ascorbata TaxID=51288 RepID=A0A3N2S1Y6_9ENTR|nr:hypothetical protein [Kluyvera ascorbata]ROU13713.1 hypothetical protein EB837_12365 [Kluyvera ascorbata]